MYFRGFNLKLDQQFRISIVNEMGEGFLCSKVTENTLKTTKNTSQKKEDAISSSIPYQNFTITP